MLVENCNNLDSCQYLLDFIMLVGLALANDVDTTRNPGVHKVVVEVITESSSIYNYWSC